MWVKLAEAVAAFSLQYLRWWVEREDIKRGERQRLVIEQLQLDRAALAWKADAAARPDGGADLRVRDDAGGIRVPGLDPDAAPGAAGDRVRSGGAR